MEDVAHIIMVASAAFFAGFVNALAGGGTLITFPVLLTVGVAPVSANMTNTVALCPGYFGAAWAQRDLIREQKPRLKYVLSAALIGGISGALLLFLSNDKLFYSLVPFLIALATLLLAFQEKIKKYISIRISVKPGADNKSKSFFPVFFASIYGGYFGAGLGVMLLSALGLTVNDSIRKLNALKQLISLFVNVAAALFFVFTGNIEFIAVAVMAAGALAGGFSGGKLSKIISSDILKKIVVFIGAVISIYYFLKIYF